MQGGVIFQGEATNLVAGDVKNDTRIAFSLDKIYQSIAGGKKLLAPHLPGLS